MCSLACVRVCACVYECVCVLAFCYFSRNDEDQKDPEEKHVLTDEKPSYQTRKMIRNKEAIVGGLGVWVERRAGGLDGFLGGLKERWEVRVDGWV